MRHLSALAAGSEASRYGHFLKSRIARVYPLYVTMLIFTLPMGSHSDLYGYGPFVVFGNRVIHFLGLISYSLYLVHPQFYRFIPAAVTWTRAYFGDFGATVYHGLPFLPVIAIAYCSYRFIEIPGGMCTKRLLGLAVSKGALAARIVSRRDDVTEH